MVMQKLVHLKIRKKYMKATERNKEDSEQTNLNNLMYNRGININVHTVHGGKK